jgi:oligopeptide/dipeptide ABC transporter ATP-binding protein
VTAVAPLLEVRSLTVEFAQRRRAAPLRAVDGVDLTIAPGETLGLVGESGSGKTTIGRAVLGLCPVRAGAVFFAGRDITHRNDFQRRTLSWDLQAIFQDPYSSLNPARTVGATLGATLVVHETLTRSQVERRVASVLARVGLPADAAKSYPIHFSGGQRQRIAIARALIVRPRLIICDEPVSALDLSVQAQILNLLSDLRDDFGLSYLFIAHDLDVVRHLSQRIVVLYRGRVMEQGEAVRVYEDPKHPYTQALLDSAPVPDPKLQEQRRNARKRHRSALASPVTGDGCLFASRCPHATDICHTTQPTLERTSVETLVACHHWRDL